MVSKSNAGKRDTCRRFLLVAYAVVVILLTTYPWNVLLLSLIAARRGKQVRGKRQEADVGTAPTRVLDGRPFVAAGRAPRTSPELVARRVGSPTDDGNGAGDRRRVRHLSQQSESQGVARCRSPRVVVARGDFIRLDWRSDERTKSSR